MNNDKDKICYGCIKKKTSEFSLEIWALYVLTQVSTYVTGVVYNLDRLTHTCIGDLYR